MVGEAGIEQQRRPAAHASADAAAALARNCQVDGGERTAQLWQPGRPRTLDEECCASAPTGKPLALHQRIPTGRRYTVGSNVVDRLPGIGVGSGENDGDGVAKPFASVCVINEPNELDGIKGRSEYRGEGMERLARVTTDLRASSIERARLRGPNHGLSVVSKDGIRVRNAGAVTGRTPWTVEPLATLCSGVWVALRQLLCCPLSFGARQLTILGEASQDCPRLRVTSLQKLPERECEISGGHR